MNNGVRWLRNKPYPPRPAPWRVDTVSPLRERINQECSWVTERLAGQSFRFNQREWKLLSSPVVYVWTRGAQTLYVGRSEVGGARCLNPRHHALNLQDGDELEVFPMFDVEEARSVEAQLIMALRPVHNRVHNLRGPAEEPAR